MGTPLDTWRCVHTLIPATAITFAWRIPQSNRPGGDSRHQVATGSCYSCWQRWRLAISNIYTIPTPFALSFVTTRRPIMLVTTRKSHHKLDHRHVIGDEPLASAYTPDRNAADTFWPYTYFSYDLLSPVPFLTASQLLMLAIPIQTSAVCMCLQHTQLNIYCKQKRTRNTPLFRPKWYFSIFSDHLIG